MNNDTRIKIYILQFDRVVLNRNRVYAHAWPWSVDIVEVFINCRNIYNEDQ